MARQIDPSTGSLVEHTIQAQTRQALANCEAILQAGGATLDDVIEVGVLLTNTVDFAGLNEEHARWFPSDPPTRYVATQPALPAGPVGGAAGDVAKHSIEVFALYRVALGVVLILLLATATNTPQ